jgi:thiol-disulfide isomerase/thioredoxin
MVNNLFQVLKEPDLDEIIEDHPENIVLIMFSSKTCGPCMSIRPKFISMANENPDCFFVYVDIPSFQNTTGKYTSNVEGTPNFVFFFNTQQIASVMGAQEETLVATLRHLKMKIQEMKRATQERMMEQKNPSDQVPTQVMKAQEQALPPTQNVPVVPPQEHEQVPVLQQQQQQPDYVAPTTPTAPSVPTVPTVPFELKLDVLKRLYDLYQRGVKLSKNYGIDSDYEEMVWEYNMHVDNINRLQQAQVPEQAQANQHMSEQQRNLSAVQETMQDQLHESELERQKKELIDRQIQQLKKQEQIRKIQELNRLNNMVQVQQVYKLQQLRNLQKMKENANKSKSDDNDDNHRSATN